VPDRTALTVEGEASAKRAMSLIVGLGRGPLIDMAPSRFFLT
jgi:hypothetical protein